MQITLRRTLTLRLAKLANNSHSSLRCFATEAPRIKHYDYAVTDVAVLGGGITGLTSAFYLSQAFPSAKITVFETSDRFGGWVRSSKLDVGGKDVYFEHGPRTLRPNDTNALATLDLIERLNLSNDILTTSKSSPAALNRYIYYPDRLVRLPSSSLRDVLRFVFREQGYEDILPELLYWQILRPRANIPYGEDESIASFLNRMVSPKIADRIASAVFHGIYAGDIYNLSALSVLPWLKFVDSVHGSFLNGMVLSFLQSRQWKDGHWLDVKRQMKDASSKWDEVYEKVKNSSVFTLKGGLEKLVQSLVARLQENPNVRLCRKQAVTRIQDETEDMLTLQITPQVSPKAVPETRHFSHIISTISGSKLMDICYPQLLYKSQLDRTHAVTVMVVNLYYTDPKLNPYSGFGYLIPREVPFEQNPELALGVIFDSDAVTGLDTASGTKLTVMLGGHWWDDWKGQYPNDVEGEIMARTVLRRHLKIDQKPDAVRVSLQRDCIPQYTVGHRTRMSKAHEHLLIMYNGRVRVAGSWFTGVGFNDCTSAAFAVAQGLKDGKMQSGLERVLPGAEKWIRAPLKRRESKASK